jgi:hypothetical protein
MNDPVQLLRMLLLKSQGLTATTENPHFVEQMEAAAAAVPQSGGIILVDDSPLGSLNRTPNVATGTQSRALVAAYLLLYADSNVGWSSRCVSLRPPHACKGWEREAERGHPTGREQSCARLGSAFEVAGSAFEVAATQMFHIPATLDPSYARQWHRARRRLTTTGRWVWQRGGRGAAAAALGRRRGGSVQGRLPAGASSRTHQRRQRPGRGVLSPRFFFQCYAVCSSL